MDLLHRRLKNDEQLFNSLKLTEFQVSNIHKDRVLIDYTDHGITHSERIIENLILLCKNNVFGRKKENAYFNEVEAFVLLSAIYLHDVGMQISDDALLEKFAKDNGVIYNSCDKIKFIRENHHLLSGYWIESNINGGKLLPQVYFGDKELGGIVKKVVESHGIDFIDNAEYKKKLSYKGKKVRLDVLCILLSLGDSLDCDCRRVDYEKLKYTEIDADSQIHWLKHYYVNSVLIENNIVKIFYSFPRLNNHEMQIYTLYFSHKNEYWIKKNKEKYLIALSEFGFVFEIQEHYEESDTKDKLSAAHYVKVEQELVDIIDAYYKETIGIPITNFRIAIGVLKEDSRVLLVKRKEQEGNLLWQFPAGIVKPKENANEKIVKEFLEETGISVKIKKLLGKRIHPDTKTICYYYALEYSSGIAQNGDTEENSEVKWVSIDTYKDLLTSDIYMEVEKYLSHI